MKKKTFERVNESLYTEKLDNGIEVYLYKTDKTKNFYISISVKYGASITKYKINDKVREIIPGSAHFLEHKVMALSENKEISRRINELGSLANAWTSYNGTNYNIFGSINIKENLKLLLDIFYNTDINPKNVEEEKGIIGEEIDMYKDKINSYMMSELFKNLFTNSYVRNTVVGERSDIAKITSKGLNKIYKDFYVPNNTFIIVCGNFDENDIMDTIKEYMSKLNLKPKKLPKVIKAKDKDIVKVPYQEIKKDINDERVKYAIKINKKDFGIKNNKDLSAYLNIILGANFSPTSSLYEKYKNEDIVTSLSYSVNIIDNYVVLILEAFTKDASRFLNEIQSDIKNLSLTKEVFERKKKRYLKNYILDFDNIEDVEYIISYALMVDNKIDYNDYTRIIELDYNKALDVLKNINSDNTSVIKTIK